MSKIRTSGQVIILEFDPHYTLGNDVHASVRRAYDDGDTYAVSATLRNDDQCEAVLDSLHGILVEYGAIHPLDILDTLAGHGFPVDEVPIIMVDLPDMD